MTDCKTHESHDHVHGPGSSIGVHSEPMPQTKAYHSAMQSSMAFTITFFTQVAFAFSDHACMTSGLNPLMAI